VLGIIRFLGVFMGFFLLFVFPSIAQPRIGGAFGIGSIAIGIVLVSIGIYICARFFIEWRKKLSALAESSYLFATGVYAKSRHPTYLGGLLLLWGWYFA